MSLIHCWKSGDWLASFFPFSCVLAASLAGFCKLYQQQQPWTKKTNILSVFTHSFLLFHCSPCRLKNAVICHNGGSEEELSIWREVARTDWERLLLHRAREMVKGTARFPVKHYTIKNFPVLDTIFSSREIRQVVISDWYCFMHQYLELPL